MITQPFAALTTAAAQRILLVAPNEENIMLLRQSLEANGGSRVETVTDSRKALPAYRETHPDVVVLDAALGERDALALMKRLAARIPVDEVLPFVVLSAGPDVEFRRACTDARLTTFFQDPSKAEPLQQLVHQLASIRRHSARQGDSVRKQLDQQRRVEEEVVRYLALLAQQKDHPGSGHTTRVGQTSGLIAVLLGMPREQAQRMQLAAQLHDVGKIGIPDAILLKRDPLTLEELDLIKTHTTIGASILAGSAMPLFQMAEEIALYHHENWDGSGYTPGLEGEAIPLVGRIVRVADAFDAMTSTRPFAEQWRRENAIEFIRSQSGRHFDPSVVEAFLEVRDQAIAVESDAGVT